MGGDLPAARRAEHARRELARTERRWMLVLAGVFVLSLAAFAGALAVYHWSGPHPGMTLFVRRVRSVLRSLVRGRRPRS